MDTDGYNKYALAGQIVRFFTASLSFAASMTIAITISSTTGRLSSGPYRRIIFGMSVADIFQSIGYLVGPFAAPSDTPASRFAVGNTATCSVVGAISSLGAIMVPMYTFGLIMYFVMRLKYGFTASGFARRVELIMHGVIWVWSLPIIIFGVVNKAFNSSRYGSMCTSTAYPLHCEIDSNKYGKCTRGQHALEAAFYFYTFPIFLCFVGIIISLIALIQYMYAQEAQLKVSRQRSGVDRSDINNSTEEISEEPEGRCCCFKKNRNISRDGNIRTTGNNTISVEPSHNSHQNSFQNLNLGRETLIQSILYFISIFMVYLFMTIYGFILHYEKVDAEWTFMAISIFSPVGGLSTILIYTRPKVATLRERDQDSYWIQLFLSVLWAGGDVPDDQESENVMEWCQSISSMVGISKNSTPAALVLAAPLPAEGAKLSKNWNPELPSGLSYDHSTRNKLDSDLPESFNDDNYISLNSIEVMKQNRLSNFMSKASMPSMPSIEETTVFDADIRTETPRQASEANAENFDSIDDRHGKAGESSRFMFLLMPRMNSLVSRLSSKENEDVSEEKNVAKVHHNKKGVKVTNVSNISELSDDTIDEVMRYRDERINRMFERKKLTHRGVSSGGGISSDLSSIGAMGRNSSVSSDGFDFSIGDFDLDEEKISEVHYNEGDLTEESLDVEKGNTRKFYR